VAVALHMLLARGGGAFARRSFHRAEGEIAQPLFAKAPDALFTRILAAVIDGLVPENHLSQVKTGHLSRIRHRRRTHGFVTKIRGEPAHQLVRGERS